MKYGYILTAVLSFLSFACASSHPDTERPPAEQDNSTGYSVEKLRALNQINTDASRFGVPPLYHPIRFKTDGSLDRSNDEVVESARFMWTKKFRHEENLLITLEHTSSGDYLFYAQQDSPDRLDENGSWRPAKIISQMELPEPEFAKAIQLFTEIDVCNYPADNSFGLDGEWFSIEYRSGDRYCFASRWSSNAADLSALGNALIEKLEIPVK